MYHCCACNKYFQIHMNCPQNRKIDSEETIKWWEQKALEWSWSPGKYLDTYEYEFQAVIVHGLSDDRDPDSLTPYYCSECLRLFDE